MQGIISLSYQASQIFIAGPIGPAIISSLAKVVITLLKMFAVQGIISWPYQASKIFIAGSIGPTIISSLARIVITLLKSFAVQGSHHIPLCSKAITFAKYRKII